MGTPVYLNPDDQRGLGLQLLIALLFGVASLLVFSFSRPRFPRVYSARNTGDPNLPHLRNSNFGWIRDVYKISNRDVLMHAGLDSYVFLMFFEASVSLLFKMTLCYYFVIAPLRWWYSGQFDEPDNKSVFGSRVATLVDSFTSKDIVRAVEDVPSVPSTPNLFGSYKWVYVAATYGFTAICVFTMIKYTRQVVDVRQAYLGLQDTITDRTMRISGIPHRLRSRNAIGRYLTILFGVEPKSITLCRGRSEVDVLYEKRTKIVKILEDLYSQYIGLNDTQIFEEVEQTTVVNSVESSNSPLISLEDDTSDIASVWGNSRPPRSTGLRETLERLYPHKKRPQGVPSYHRNFAPNLTARTEDSVDLIDYYTNFLVNVDNELKLKRESAETAPFTNMAFITMDTVAQCQISCQVKLSPLPHTLVSTLAPSPADIVWSNVYLKPKQRSIYNYVITISVLIVNAFLAVPLTYLTRFLDLRTITEHFPELGDFLADRPWLSDLVTQVLSTYVFASFNLFVPYVFSWLSKRQGFVSKTDIELSTVSKNFFYLFVNLFLIFPIGSALYSFTLDEFAKHFAYWVLRLASFYTNLIVLQGIGIAPSKLLQLGDVSQFPFLAASCKTARDCYNLYKPPNMNFGLVLPNSLFIFIIVLTYSTLRGRILLFGLIYFAVSYIVYKYQLMYTTVHSRHSTGRLWITVVRRVYLGLGMFHLAVFGVLISQSSFILSILILPLTVLLLGFWYDFEKFTKPLFEFVAIEALHQSQINFSNLASCQRRASQTFNRATASSTADPTNARAQEEGLAQTFGDNASDTVRTNDSDDYEEEAGEAEGLWEDRNGPHEETVDEIREKNLDYENAAWSAPLDGPWVATDGFRCVVANGNELQLRDIPHNEWL